MDLSRAESTATRPAPVLTDDNAAFWQAAAEHRLVAQRCTECGRLRHPPRPMCPSCHSLAFAWVDLSGNGVVYSYSVLHHPRNPAFTYPLVAALVDLDEGIRLVTNLVAVNFENIRVGLPVRVTFEAIAHDMAVPVFEPQTPTP
jgi:uncharacterized OB-fold protein